MSGYRVVHVTSVHVWSDTRIFHRMCRGLSRRNWEVSLVAPNVPAQTVDGVRVVGVRVPTSRILRALVGGYRVIVAACAIDADLYHIHDPELLLWKWIFTVRKRPVVYDMHEYVPGAISTRRWVAPRLRKVLAVTWAVFERMALRRSLVILAEASYSKHYTWLRNAVTILNMPDTETLLDISEAEKIDSVIYVGRVSAARGSCQMLEAMDELRRRGVAVSLDIVGPIAERHKQELTEMLHRRGLECVTLHGYMKPLQAWQLAKRSVAGLAVLSPEPNYIESFPTKMFEYMALGLPVVVSNFPLYRAVVDSSECGICVDPRDASALADAIERLMKDRPYARRLGANGRSAIQARYRWDRELDALEGFYMTIVSRSRTGAST
ncbi:MAG: glycosyltransferase [Acidobacteria bacterium]|nr:MAG: glycosyltransferase [Acidobacteriota bacterium]